MAKYFTLNELTYSHVAVLNDIDNTPSEEIKKNLEELMEDLDSLREAWGGAIKITSGYRCKELNEKVGGGKTSVHPYGFAADMKPFNNDMDKFCEVAKEWAKNRNFDQLIEESNKEGSRWLHYGKYNQKGQQRKQIKKLNKK